MLGHLLAPVHRDAAARLELPRTLPAGSGAPGGVGAPGVSGAPGVPGVSGAPGVALTFDDGPHPEGTPAVLEALAAAGARATFFVIGEQVERRPELVMRLLA